MSPALANFLFEAANFLLLAAVLGWVLFRPVRAALDRERAQHDKETEDSKRLRAEAESLATGARAARDAADRETAQKRAEILAAAQEEAARILENAKKTEATERATLLQELEQSREAEAAVLVEHVGRIAAESVRRLLLAISGPALELSLVRAACKGLRVLPESARRSATIESAHELEADAKGLLQEVLGAPCSVRTVRELGAGVRVTTPAGQIDASALSFSREAARAVSAVLAEETEAAGAQNA